MNPGKNLKSRIVYGIRDSAYCSTNYSVYEGLIAAVSSTVTNQIEASNYVWYITGFIKYYSGLE